MEYKIQKDFLSTELFTKIKNLIITNRDFSWKKRDQMTPCDHYLCFVHYFYDRASPTSDFYKPFILPILTDLQAYGLVQIRANMFISSLFKASGWHTDYGFKSKTAILYLNDCDGGTELKIDDKITFIKADANKMLVFDTPIPHRAITSKKEPIRYIINFNYFTS